MSDKKDHGGLKPRVDSIDPKRFRDWAPPPPPPPPPPPAKEPAKEAPTREAPKE